MAERIRAIMIVEMAGRPAKHVKESLERHVKQLNDKVKDIDVVSLSVSEAKEVEKGKDFYSCFSEIEFDCPNFLRLVELVFDFMPSSIEIIEPAELRMNMQEATSFLNVLSGRLHRYDEIAKIAQLQNHQLVVRLQEMQQGMGGGQKQGQTIGVSYGDGEKEKVEKKKVRKKKGKGKKKKSKPSPNHL